MYSGSGDQNQSSGPAAGWFPDNENPGGFRWWDGQGWTQHRSPPPAAAAPQPSYGAPQQQFTPQPLGGAPQQFGQPQQQFGAQQPQQFGAQQFGAPQQQFGSAQPWQVAQAGVTAPEPAKASPAALLAWVGVIGLLIGPFLAWLSASQGNDSATTSGVDGDADFLWIISSIPDGYVAVALGAIGAIGAAIFMSKGSRGAAGLVSFAGSGAISWIVASFLHAKSRFDAFGGLGNGISLSPGVGMWIAGIGAILALIGGIMLKLKSGGAAFTTSRGSIGF